MFLTRLDRRQREAFVNLARDLVAADNVSALGEITHLCTLRRELGIGADETTAVLGVDAAAERFPDHESRTIVLIELVNLATADRNYSARESHLVTRLCSTWGVDGRRLSAIEAWARRYRELMLEGHTMLADSCTAAPDDSTHAGS